MKKKTRIIPGWKDYDWKGSKNQLSEHEDRYVVEVLLDQPSLQKEITYEEHKRDNTQEHADSWRPFMHPKVPESVPKTVTQMADQPLEPVIDEVRLRAPAVIQMLEPLMAAGEGWPIKARGGGVWARNTLNFRQPFRLFIHSHAQMIKERDRLRGLEHEGVGNQMPGHVDENETTQGTEHKHTSDYPSTLSQFECFIEFVEKRILPYGARFQSDTPSEEPPDKIRYEELSYLFRPGQIVHIQQSRKPPSSIEHSLWKVYKVIVPGDWIEVEVPVKTDTGTLTKEVVASRFTLKCYYIDFDGKKYGAVIKDFVIDPYSPGQKKRTSSLWPPFRCAISLIPRNTFIKHTREAKSLWTW